MPQYPPYSEFNDILTNFVGVDDISQVNKQNFKRALTQVDASKKQKRKAIRGLSKYQKKNAQGNTFTFNDNGTFGITDSENSGLRGSGVRKGNQVGFGAGDLLGIGNDVSNFAGILSKESRRLTKLDDDRAASLVPKPEYNVNIDDTESLAKKYAPSIITDAEIQSIIDENPIPEEEIDTFTPDIIDPNKNFKNSENTTIIQDGIGTVEIPFKINAKSSAEDVERANQWYAKIRQSQGYDVDSPPTTRLFDYMSDNSPAGVGEDGFFDATGKSIRATAHGLNSAQFTDYVKRGGIDRPNPLGTHVNAETGKEINIEGGHPGQNAGLGPMLRFANINTNPEFLDSEFPLGDKGITYNDILNGFIQDGVPIGSSMTIPGGVTPQKLINYGIKSPPLQLAPSKLRLPQGQKALPVGKQIVQPQGITTKINTPPVKTITVSPKGTANVTTAPTANLTSQLNSKLKPAQIQKEIGNLEKLGRKRGVLSDGTRIKKMGKAGKWGIYSTVGTGVTAAGIINTTEAEAAPDIYKKSNIIKKFGSGTELQNFDGTSDTAAPLPGVKIKASNNITPVKGGEITAIGVTGLGTSIIMLHEDGSRTIYTGIAKDSLKVKKGDIITKETIMGNSSNGKDIMLSLWEGDGMKISSVDPTKLLLKKGGKIRASNLLNYGKI